MLSLLAIPMIVFVLVISSGPRAEAEELKKIANTMKAQLEGWGNEVKVKDPDDIFNAYFAFLCQASVGKLPPDSKHPYVAFIRRLPAQAAKASQKQWVASDVTEAMHILVVSLGEQDAGSLEDNLQNVDRSMNYDSWRKKDRKPAEDLGRFAVSPEPNVCRFVERFRNGASANFKPVSESMQRYLRQWGVETDAKPFQVMQSFFTTLQRPSFLDACSSGDKGHAYWRFLSRLPGEANNLGWTCDNVDQLDVALKEVLKQEASDGKTTNGLVEAIAIEMNYDKWVKQPGLQWKTEGKPESQELVKYVERFRPGSGGTPIAPQKGN